MMIKLIFKLSFFELREFGGGGEGDCFYLLLIPPSNPSLRKPPVTIRKTRVRKQFRNIPII